MKLSEEQDNELQKVADYLGEQMSRLIRVKGKEVDWDDRCEKHIKSAQLSRNISEVKKRIERQGQWLRSNLNASPEEKAKVKARLDEMKKAKSELIDEYTQLQLP